MAYVIKDEHTVELIRELARRRRKSLADTIRDAIAHEMDREKQRVPLIQRLRPLHEKHGFLDRRPDPDWADVKRQSDSDWGEN